MAKGYILFPRARHIQALLKMGSLKVKANISGWIGAVYSGDWHQNKMHGTGTFIDPEKVRWEGKFHNGKYYNGRCYVTLR